MMYKASALLLSVATVVFATAEMKQDSPNRPKHHVKHGNQDFMTSDGKHNIHFDHLAIVGSVGDEEAFDKMEPKEAKYRLSLIAKRMDRNFDGYVSREELTDWIVMSYRILDEQEALEEFLHFDEDDNEKLSWDEFFKQEFNQTENVIEQSRGNKKDTEHVELIRKFDAAKRKFQAADVDKDHFLNRTEYFAFVNPENYAHMHKLAVDERMDEYDKDGDRKFSLKEFRAGAAALGDQELVDNEQEIFGYLDKNNDSFVDYDEVREWVLNESRSGAEDEADDLIKEADVDQDDQLSEYEIVEKHDLFVGSTATNEGKQLHFIRHADEEL